MSIDELSVQIIANAGDSKSESLEAIETARKGDIESARKMLENSMKSLLKAHEVHTEFLVNESRGEVSYIPFILVHASNHLSVAEVTRDFAEIIINIYEEMKKNV